METKTGFPTFFRKSVIFFDFLSYKTNRIKNKKRLNHEQRTENQKIPLTTEQSEKVTGGNNFDDEDGDLLTRSLGTIHLTCSVCGNKYWGFTGNICPTCRKEKDKTTNAI